MFFAQVSKSMSGVVKSMDATLKSMNLEKVKNTSADRHIDKVRQNMFIKIF